MFGTFGLKAVFLVAIASNKQKKQIDHQLMTDRQLDMTRAQLFGLYLEKYGPWALCDV